MKDFLQYLIWPDCFCCKVWRLSLALMAVALAPIAVAYPSVAVISGITLTILAVVFFLIWNILPYDDE